MTLLGRALAVNGAVTLDTNSVTVPSSVALRKAFAPESLPIGGTTRLTFTLSNASAGAQGGLAFTDTLPSGLAVACLAGGLEQLWRQRRRVGVNHFTRDRVDWPEHDLLDAVNVTNAPAATTALACPAPSLTNGTANISGRSLNLAPAAGFGACVNLVESANLSISKTPPVTLVAGQTVAYTLTVHNAGPSPAQTVTAADTLPASLTFVSGTPGCTAVGQAVSCELGTLASGQTVPITLNVRIAPDLAPGTTIANTANVNSSTSNPDPSDNTSTTSSPAVTASADLATVKSAIGASVIPGASFTYRVVVTNNGPSTAANVSTTDPFPRS